MYSAECNVDLLSINDIYFAYITKTAQYKYKSWAEGNAKMRMMHIRKRTATRIIKMEC